MKSEAGTEMNAEAEPPDIGQFAGAICGLAAATLIGVGLLIAGFLPPPSPNDTAEEIARTYSDNTVAIRAGIAVAAFGSFLLVGWYGALAVEIKRMEGRRWTLTFIWIIAGAGSMMDFVLPFLFMETAAFRPENTDFVQGFNDLGWTCFLAAPYIFGLQAVVLAAAVFGDRGPEPRFPRWFGYMSAWSAVLFLPGAFVVFVKTGPLAWPGVLAWWIPLAAFGAWLMTAAVLTIKAARREPQPLPTNWASDADRAE